MKQGDRRLDGCARALHRSASAPARAGVLRTLAAVAVASYLLGCHGGSSGGSDPARRGAESAPEPQAVEAPVVIRFSDPGNAGVMAVAKRTGILERELAKVNARIEWVPAAGAFSANFEAMNSGAINASISPILGALSHHLRFKIYALSDPGGIRVSGVLSPPHSDIRSVRQLPGKRVAVNLAAHGDYVLLKALANQGIPADQVQRIPIQPPDAAAAFATGKIDAWSTFGVFFSTAVRNGAHVLVTEDQIDSDDVGVLAAHATALEKNPAAFRALVDVSQQLTAEAREHPERYNNVFTDKEPTAVSGDELRIAIDETRKLPAYRLPTASDRARVANVASLLYRNKSIDRDMTVDDVIFDLDRAVAAHP
ncbi:MAG: NrtA/SsuA/CpmA family ABC transporter substrate-binding protein [Polyangiaceae bacterium]|jgi:sulfonate transport system substrate-binding protein